MNGTSLCGTQVKCLAACAPTSIPMFCACHANETCPVAGHDLFINLFILSTCFNIMQFIVIKPMQFDHLLQTAKTVFIKDIHFKTTFMR